MNILIALLLLGFIILIHELGHFLSARYFKMPIEEFSIGMGPEIYSYYTGEMTYSIKVFPMGGYVSILGMEPESNLENGFNKRKPFQRLIVLSAGIIMNFLLALLIIMGMTFSRGKTTLKDEPIISSVLPESNARSILAKGDLVKSIDGVQISNWNEIGEVINKITEKKTVQMDIVRDGVDLNLDVPLLYLEKEKRSVIGIAPSYTVEPVGLKDGIIISLETFKNIFVDTINGFKMLVKGQVKMKEISGPIGIIKTVGEVSKQNNFDVLLWLIVILSVNVGIFNLLPFPALDGGRILFVCLECIGLKVNKKLEERIHMIGMAGLLILIVYTTLNDFMNILN